VGDGVDALLRIIENKNGCASRRIFNLGNPANNVSVADLAKIVVEAFKDYPAYREHAEQAKIIVTSSQEYFGQGYQDIQTRVPSIKAAKEALGWNPQVDLRTAIKHTLDYHLEVGGNTPA